MFAGIWCMMKMFHIASQNASNVQLDNPPENVVLAMEDNDNYEYFCDLNSSNISDFEIETAVSQSYDNIDDFEADFDYELKPEYEAIEIPLEGSHT